MAAPYLLEVRLGQPIKDDVREIIRDVADEFGVKGAVQHRPVPHITLFGPYDTSRGYEVKDRTQSVLQEYDVVPYRVEGFGHFGRNSIYANVKPSPELQNLRRDLAAQLRPVCYNYRDYDSDPEYDFHVTIAYDDIRDQFDEIWEYVNRNYDPYYEEYATRITSLKHRNMMWEWDLPRGQSLSSGEATSRPSWKKTMAELKRLQSEDNHCVRGKDTGTTRKNAGENQMTTTQDTCVRCQTAIVEGGVQFKRRTYCDSCIELFEAIARNGVVVRSRHGKHNFHEKPYLVSGGGKQYVEHSQTEALARGKELTEKLDCRGLFIFWKHGSHWVLDRYLAEHPGMESRMQEERRKIRGKTPITREPETDTVDEMKINIRAQGDAIVDSTVVDDSVVNRSDIGGGDREQ